jgi:hypothetical protein
MLQQGFRAQDNHVFQIRVFDEVNSLQNSSSFYFLVDASMLYHLCKGLHVDFQIVVRSHFIDLHVHTSHLWKGPFLYNSNRINLPHL